MSMLDKALRDQNRDLTFAVGQWQRHAAAWVAGVVAPQLVVSRPARPLAVKAGPRFEYGRQFGQSDAEPPSGLNDADAAQ